MPFYFRRRYPQDPVDNLRTYPQRLKNHTELPALVLIRRSKSMAAKIIKKPNSNEFFRKERNLKFL